MAPALDLSFLRSRGAQKRIILAVAAGAALGAAYALFTPRWYRSVLTVVPAKQQKPGLSGLLGGDLGALAGGLDLGGNSADAQRISAVLQSIAVSDAVIDKFNLKARYDEKYQEFARQDLWRHCEAKILVKPNLVQLSCEDQDPQFVKEMLSYFADIGNQVFQRVNVGSATEEVRVMEKRVAELRTQADESAARMREFQETHQIVDLDAQAKALVTSVAAVNAQRITKKMELDYARGFASRDEASSRKLESQLLVMDEALRDLEQPTEAPAPAGNGKRDAKGLFPAAMSVPKLRAEYERLYRDRKVAEATLIFALDRLESARASKARDVSTFQVLDPPTVPTRKSRPRGLESLLTGTILGFLAGVLTEALRARESSRRTGP